MTTHARVRITVDIPLGDNWGDDCTTEQIKKQALDGAENALMHGLVLHGLRSGDGTKHEGRIVDHEVTMILMTGKAKR